MKRKRLPINQIIQGDCIEVMKELPDKSMDLIVTDPPYLIEYKTSRRKDRNHDFCNTILNDDNPELIKNYIAECYRIMKDNTAIYIFCNFNKVDFFKQELEKYFTLKNMIVWIKNNHTAGDLKTQFGKQYELIFLANKGRAPFYGERLTDVWNFRRITGNKQFHQNQKPEDLIACCINKHSEEGQIVFDGFIGSGTTAVAAINTGRNFIGIEIEEKYVKIARKRIEACKKLNQMRLFPLSVLEKTPKKYKGLFE